MIEDSNRSMIEDSACIVPDLGELGNLVHLNLRLGWIKFEVGNSFTFVVIQFFNYFTFSPTVAPLKVSRSLFIFKK